MGRDETSATPTRTKTARVSTDASSAVCDTGKKMDSQLRDYIIDVWKRDNCRLARCYTSEKHFYELLLALPEVMSELIQLRPTEELKYEVLRTAKKQGLDEAVVSFFRPFGLQTPAE